LFVFSSPNRRGATAAAAGHAGAALALAGVGIGIVGGVILGLLAWFAGGAAGPGRLVDVGPNPWAVGIAAALEIAIAATIGLFASRRRSASERSR
jgi:hypothetical protein